MLQISGKHVPTQKGRLGPLEKTCVLKKTGTNRLWFLLSSLLLSSLELSDTKVYEPQIRALLGTGYGGAGGGAARPRPAAV